MEKMVGIFKRAGEILYIKMPHLPDGQGKGFCFVEYRRKEDAQNAVKMFNNLVPEEFVDSRHPLYVEHKERDAVPLRVLLKSEWQEYKQLVNKIKKEVSSLAFGSNKQDSK